MALSKEQSELLQKIQADNIANGVTWIAGETTMLYLSDDERKLRLGVSEDPNDIPLAEREERSRRAYADHLAQSSLPGSAAAPVAFDWRNVSGQNYISPIKNQGHCGSCVAFGTTAAIDAAMRIAANLPVSSPGGGSLQDLSEAQLFYCGGGTCANGWNVSSALPYCQANGLVPESSYPYTAGQQACSLPNGWQSTITKITSSAYLLDIQSMKNMLSASGPLIIPSLSVYDDFYSYTSGVYKWNGVARHIGYHCICLVGYDDGQQAWICKNSWGTGWGMQGYFLIAYGECGVDASMWGVNSFSTVYPYTPGGTTYTLSLDNSGNSTWSPHNPNENAGWLDGDKLVITCSFNTTATGNPPATAYNGLSIGAACNQDQTNLNALLTQVQSLSGTTGQLAGTGITNGAAGDAAIFYNAQSAIIPSIPLKPSSRGSLTNFIYQWTMTYNGNNTVVNNETQAALVFGYGYQLSGIINNQ
jgi:C1A family cysteine protease